MAKKPSPEFLLVVGLIAIAGYLGLWPVPITPVPWDAPADAGLVAPFAPNDRLADVDTIDLGRFAGPEDVAVGPDGFVYASTENGSIVRTSADGRTVSEFAATGGRPLGIEFDRAGNLWVANAMLGLQRISPDGRTDTLFDEFGGDPIVYANDLAVATDGKIYLTESSTKFGAADWGGTFAASVLDILEHSGKGRLYEYDPDTDSVRLMLVGINFANGVAISPDQRYLLLAETANYRIWRYWLTGATAGSVEVIIDNLPGFPDNINAGLDGRYWVGLVAPRNALVDRMADTPFLRSVVQRLPAFARPTAEPSSHLIAIDGAGSVIMNLQDTAAGFPMITGAFEGDDGLYLSSLRGHRIAVVPADSPALPPAAPR